MVTVPGKATIRYKCEYGYDVSNNMGSELEIAVWKLANMGGEVNYSYDPLHRLSSLSVKCNSTSKQRHKQKDLPLMVCYISLVCKSFFT